MKKINNQYKSVAIVSIYWHHLLQWLRLLVLALTRSRKWVPPGGFPHPGKPALVTTTIFQYQNILKQQL
jgi:hypothetical protein